MTQLLAAHTKLGRRDPRFCRTADLIAAGAPLRAAVGQRQGKRKCATTASLYASSQLHVAKRRRLAASGAGPTGRAVLSKAERNAVMRESFAEFRRMSPQERLRYAHLPHSFHCERPDDVDPAGPISAEGVQAGFFGQGSVELPIGAKAMQDALRAVCAVDEDADFEDLPGFTSYSTRLRQLALERMLVKDRGSHLKKRSCGRQVGNSVWEVTSCPLHAACTPSALICFAALAHPSWPRVGDIPKKKKFKDVKNCWSNHHGLCETRDADRFAALQELGAAFGSSVAEGLWYKVHAECGDEADQSDDHDTGAMFVFRLV